jgi:RimJ/RimL family protein N-acetyltransferase
MIASPRLHYQPLEPAAIDDFHRLVTDEHVRRYMMDGKVYDRAWSADRVADSQTLFARRGVGLWLARLRAGGALLGFCGFLELPDDPDPQLVYGLFAAYTGQGYASEMALAAIAQARRQPGFEVIHAAVDQVNTASRRVLERLGFARTGVTPGAFGDVLSYQLVSRGPG